MSLQQEIINGESRTLEFKKILPKENLKWIKTVVAFANGAGGRIVIGVTDKREIFGIHKDEDIFLLKDKISNIISQSCSPQIMFDIYQESIDGKVVIVLEVFPGNDTPYYVKSLGKTKGSFIRLGATSRETDIVSLDELELRGKRKYYDELPFSEINVLDKDVKALCKSFSQRAGRKISQEMLENMRLLLKRGSKFVATRAYAIFVGKHDWQTRIQCARFKGTERVNFIDKRTFDGPLLDQVESAYNFVLSHINLGAEIKGLYRHETYELPETVIRELILNAVIHRNYMMSSCIQVAVYDDRIEISSPGNLFGTLTLKEALEGRSSIRNKIIASVCEKLGIVEGWGTGLKRIMDTCKEMHIRKPEFLEIGDLLRVNFYRPSFKKEQFKMGQVKMDGPINDPINGPIKDPINDPIKLIDIIKINPNGSYEQYATTLGISATTVKRKINALKQQGIIAREGSKKSGKWIILIDSKT